MMRELGQYVVTLTCAAFVCGLVPALLQDSGTKNIVRLVCGVFLTVTALSPLTRFELPDISQLNNPYLEEGKSAAARGEELALAEKTAFIKAGLEAYILDKAAGLGEKIFVHVSMNEDGLPLSVEIGGEVSRQSREALTQAMESELGIPKEKQRWTGQKLEP